MNLLLIVAGALAGNFTYERFVEGRFVQASDGFGADDIVRALMVGVGVWGVAFAANRVGVRALAA